MATIFRLKDNVPDIYIKESRDFQLLCNVFDAVNLSVKSDIDSMLNILDTQLCKDSVIPLLQTKLGFFTKYKLTNTEIRHVLSAFKRLVKDKGSEIGVMEAIEIYLKLLDQYGTYRINIINTEKEDFQYNGKTVTKSKNVYLIIVEMKTAPKNIDVLKAMLEYIIPTGYRVEFGFYTSQEFVSNIISDTSSIQIYFVDSSSNNAVQEDGDIYGNVSTTRSIEVLEEEKD